jgi:hypothetical protein
VEDFEYIGKVDPKKLAKLAPTGENADSPEDWIQPYDYEEIFAPKEEEDLRKLVGGKAPVGSDEDDRKRSKSSKEKDKDDDDDDDDKDKKSEKKKKKSKDDDDPQSIDDLFD